MIRHVGLRPRANPTYTPARDRRTLIGRNKRSALRRMEIDGTIIGSRVGRASPPGITRRDGVCVPVNSVERTRYAKAEVVIACAGEFVAICGTQIIGLVADPGSAALGALTAVAFYESAAIQWRATESPVGVQAIVNPFPHVAEHVVCAERVGFE